MDDIAPLMCSDEVAAVFRVNPKTVREWHAQGKLRALRLGRRLRFRRADIERLIRSVDDQAQQPMEAA